MQQPPDLSSQSLEQQVNQALATVAFDEQHSITEADAIEKFELSGKQATITFRADKIPPQKEQIQSSLLAALKPITQIEQIKLIFPDAQKEPKPSQNITPQRASLLSNYRQIVLVGSGKGGVGKSTVAVNLAAALKKMGKSVALFDADIYGPSIPTMFGLRDAKPTIMANKMNPLSRYGIELMSIGSMLSVEQGVAWRGPMVHQAVQQLLQDTNFSGGDYFIIDLPPGTGDVQITLAQLLSAAGVVIVSTPQEVAWADVRRSIAMFEKVNIPILGVVENMTYFSCPKCGEKTEIFGAVGRQAEYEAKNIPVLGSLPLDLNTRIGGDSGKPIVIDNPSAEISQAFLAIANALDRLL